MNNHATLTPAQVYEINREYAADNVQRSLRFGWTFAGSRDGFRARHPRSTFFPYTGSITLEGMFITEDFDKLVGLAGVV